MNFFKSVFSDDPDPPEAESDSISPKSREEQQNLDHDLSPEQSNTGGGGVWSFGGLIKTLATRSESVIETYRRDLQEFGSGLKKEIEVAQGSLGTVGHVIDEFGNSVLKGTAQIIAQGKDAIQAADIESDSSDNNSSKGYGLLSSKRYNRFDAHILVLQGDVNTYCEEPEDLDDFNKWKLGFGLDQKGEELERLFEENDDMRSIYKRVVPSSVDHETFWYRYFYKVYKLKQAEDLRANLVKRAISREDEEELSWDIDDEEEDDEKVVNPSKSVSKMKLKENEEMGIRDVEQKANDEVKKTYLDTEKASSVEKTELANKNYDKIVKEENSVEVSQNEDEKKGKISDLDNVAGKESLDESRGDNMVSKKETSEAKPDVIAMMQTKDVSGESSKTSSVSVISSQPSVQEEEDLGWDEIEDLSNIDGKDVTHSGSSPNRPELRKKLSAAEEKDEDLSWDIEDDDEETVKA